ncbi:dynamin family protein [Brevibacillus centrosporus]|uniref:dynamin family protein n=1 Tax=Brevibacillus centrosporus TaxID=54910 RepID=UPI000F0A964C|nr:dynamin family protein [Brevibacillus centrosporus]MEC2130238.1 dynamin family protein [Brevibacillus centrosporus]RNB70954.1 hypothetical protein EDM55_09220 [Brevibacillus centrosporus]GED30268.1 hypothetical protein BCE02nite_14090 [Brevibacillus centrosporus]
MPSIIRLLNDERLIHAIRHILPGESVKSAFDQSLASRKQSVTAQKFVIAVLGIQGAGKSSLLNALVVGDDILPVEADETTCIPVEIHKSADGSHRGIVHYKDGRTESVAVEREALNRFVNHECNPDNALGVHHIELHIHSHLLRPDVVFVDLPGVASLSSANQETTMKYIMSCSGAIFLLRTIPPITRIESLFLKAVWPQISNAYFVQNWWENETERELESGMKHNQDALEKISLELGVRYEQQIIPVQVKDAVKATYTKDMSLCEKSGIRLVENRLEESMKTWSEEIMKVNIEWIGQKILESERMYESILKDLDKDRETAELELGNQIQKFHEEKEKTISQFDELKAEAETLFREARRKMSRFIEEVEEGTVKHIDEKISSGIYDGHYFETVVTEQLQEAQLLIVNELQYQIREIIKKILVDFESILKHVHETNPNIAIDADCQENFKFERAVPALLSLGLMAVAPALVPLIVSNPVGWVVGGAIVVAGVIGNLLGFSIKSEVEKQRRAGARKAAKSIVIEVIEQLQELVKRETGLYEQQIIQDLEKLLMEELNHIESEFTQRQVILEKSLDYREQLYEDTQELLQIIKNSKVEWENVRLMWKGEHAL